MSGLEVLMYAIRPGMVHTAKIRKVTGERFPGNNWVILQSWVDAETRMYGGSTYVYRATWREAIEFAFAHARGERPPPRRAAKKES